MTRIEFIKTMCKGIGIDLEIDIDRFIYFATTMVHCSTCPKQAKNFCRKNHFNLENNCIRAWEKYLNEDTTAEEILNNISKDS